MYNKNNYDLHIFLYTYFALLLIILWKGHDDTNIFLYLLLMASIPNNTNKFKLQIENRK